MPLWGLYTRPCCVLGGVREMLWQPGSYSRLSDCPSQWADVQIYGYQPSNRITCFLEVPRIVAKLQEKGTLALEKEA